MLKFLNKKVLIISLIVLPLAQKQIQKPAQDGRGSLNEIERQLDELDKLRLGR